MWENTPLIYACQYRHVDIALHLIDRGANVNHSNERGNTPLLHAAVEGLEQLASALLEKGANPNTPPSLIYNSVFDTSEYLTPLSAASLNGYNELLSMFLNHGASLDPPISNGNAKNLRGLTPLTLACTKIPSHLEKGQKNYNKLVSVLLQAGANVNQVNEHEQTALLVAVSSGLGEIVLTQLLSAGSDPTHQDCNGCTALFLAVKHNNPNAAMMLIEHGADVNQVHGEAQRTCLHEACSNSSAQCARILLNAGARPGVADAYGTYPLEIAQGGDDIELEVLIEQHLKLDKSDRVQRAEKCT